MASSTHFCMAFATLLLISTSSFAQQSFRPKALVIPVTKDASTLQYTTRISQRTPLVPVSLVLDLGGQYLWVDCEQSYVSSSYRPARCRSSQCSLAAASGCGECFSPPGPGCNNNTCGVTPDNSVTHTATSGEVASDSVSVQSTTGLNPGQNVTVSNFLFACAPTFLLNGLANGVKGMAGLGRTKIALSSQFASAFSFKKVFAVCLSSSTSANGVAFFGDGPYTFLPGISVDSDDLTFTPLFINPVSTASAYSQGDASSEYFIKVNSIKVNDKKVNLNTSLLSINTTSGFGGTKISTVDPYTVLEASIYKAVTEAFITESTARGMTTVSSVAPFKACFSASSVSSTRLGPGVPEIDLVLQNESTMWRFYGANSMVYVSDDVLCLGFVNGGENVRTSVVIGGYQLENNLVQFDLAASKVGFSSSLLGRQTTCANFNFTSVA